MNLEEQLAALVKKANDSITLIKAESREPTETEQTDLKSWLTEANGLKAKIAAAKSHAATLSAFANFDLELGGEKHQKPFQETSAKNLGEHFALHAKSLIPDVKGRPGASISSPEFGLKAATDTIVTGGPTGSLGAYLTQLDKTIVEVPRRATVADLFRWGKLTSQSITYLVEGPREGDFETVAEGAPKPQLSYVKPTPVTDAVSKIAGFIEISDEMFEDLDFLVSEINTRLVYDLEMAEENQLLNGDGVGSNLLGLLNRAGVLTVESAAPADNADAVFRAITRTTLASDLTPDGVVINPLDYEALRLTKDANGQYLAGGPFLGAYGGGQGVAWQPPLWALRTVVSTAVPQGTAVVGAFAQGATPYRRGGVRVESTNAHAENFTSNLVTTRAEERIALAVRRPAAFAKVTLAQAPVV